MKWDVNAYISYKAQNKNKALGWNNLFELLKDTVKLMTVSCFIPGYLHISWKYG